MRKAPEASDDVVVALCRPEAGVAILVRRQRGVKLDTALLVGQIFAVRERQIEEPAPDRCYQAVESPIDRVARSLACRAIAAIGERRAAKEISRQLIEVEHEGKSGIGHVEPLGARTGSGRFMVGEKAALEFLVKGWIGLEPDIARSVVLR